MKPVDHVNPTVPSNWVRRVEDKRRLPDRKQREQREQDQQNRTQKQPPGQDPDGRTHIIDDLA